MLKEKLAGKPMLHAPDFSESFIFQTDASDQGYGVVLTQKDDNGKEYPICFSTDHNPLVWLKNNAGNNGQLLRWALALQSFNFAITHKKGKDNLNVDCLSRNSLHSD
ncbi:retrovirus-related Pol polyprotein from transposon 17.6 [Trichonephila clavipes]|nr:retrovirus-related Pol polyprotein from transposon 17.6 [Trichonephila clavipes]